ncbi:AAA-domain-containing protein [Punctularia strigosozonata HHB-11173 SS5]|uniref:AAA-domain-containing protein n=1 Tax=Punctularia strigosozonata (strain HHB-11173) TaxID=741275 RepID=UPI00044163B4|nr:AAA-domain-containing protein [Punctularia strigosozonata HHB-11173 SS5]EIN07490.1 AAA-domain-containing protein [Punctularia strigosozonata HHB-11173 SS5]
MRSQAALVRHSRVLLAPSTPAAPKSSSRLFHPTTSRRLPRKPPPHVARAYRTGTTTTTTSASSAPAASSLSSEQTQSPIQPNVDESEPPEPVQDVTASGATPPEDPEPEPEPEKPRRRTRSAPKESASSSSTTTTSSSSPSNPPLPPGLHVLWSADHDLPAPNPAALPPAPIFDEVLSDFRIALHPQTQHRSIYASPRGPTVEPTLGLYCPIEGGDYVLDETVRELARRTGADVVVLDAVQLAAGEHGQFGKANVLQLSPNPLHFTSHVPAPSAPAPPSSTRSAAIEDGDEDDTEPFAFPSRMTIQISSPTASGRAGSGGRTFLAASARSASSSRLKAFFDELVNLAPPPPPPPPSPSPTTPNSSDSDTTTTPPPPLPPPPPPAHHLHPRLPHPRRLLPHLVPPPPRRRPISRSTSPVSDPMVIVFGMTPPLTPSSSSSPSSSHSGGAAAGLVSLLTSRSAGSAPLTSGARATAGRDAWAEDAASDAARERRLRQRLRRWERGGGTAWLDDLPRLSSASGSEGGGGGSGGSGADGEGAVVVVGAPPSGLAGLPAALQDVLRAASGGGGNGSGSGSGTGGASGFWKAAFVVPSARSGSAERACRVARRREVNVLTMRMGIAAAGGALADAEPAAMRRAEDEDEEVEGEGEGEGEGRQQEEAEKMWAEWGRRIETWDAVRRVADRAVGGAYDPASAGAKPSLEPTPIGWDAVCAAWRAMRTQGEVRRAWAAQAAREDRKEAKDEEGPGAVGKDNDEVIERVRRDPDLDQHEQRLLGCIVQPSTVPTSFSQVHLPAHTIDAVRTIVSLPLLYPDAFNHGILKEHGMTGCLLFGPPGTGKTLLAKAVAGEAGCRMLAVAPSDVMDMYVGEGEKLVKSLFSLARRLAPCVVFVDEIDALFGARASGRESGGAIAHRGVLTEFMQEMDGLWSSREDNVVVIGATNRPFDLDDAVLRRLPRRLLIDLPGEKEREEILKILLRDETLAPDVDLKALAKQTETFSGSDLKHLCVAAALDAVKERVSVPWAVSSAPPEPSVTVADPPAENAAGPTAEGVADGGDRLVEPAAASSALDTEPQKSDSTPRTKDDESEAADAAGPPDRGSEKATREIAARHFKKALSEITPSASEALGTLADLRKWNAEFGEGRKEKKLQVWGKGRFGFAIANGDGGGVQEGHVAPSPSPATTEQASASR